MMVLKLTMAAVVAALAFGVSGAYGRDQIEEMNPPAERIDLLTEDGLTIAALHTAPADTSELRPAIVMLHGANQRKEMWWEVGFTTAVAGDNYHLLAIDIRGRGESEAGDVEALRQNPALAHYDLEAAIAWLADRDDVDLDRIALVGSSYGSNLIASWMMTNDEPVKTIVCLSATAATYRFLGAFEDSHKIKSSGLYIASDNENARYKAAETAEKLSQDTEGRSELKIYSGRQHALGILVTEDGSTELVKSWLKQELDPEE